jgi:pSer/pThr/pTyr-binding forkhead associated (FHA) protein
VADESVSETHAKIQRRETGWFVVDIDSTNGTYVSGQRIVGEAPLVHGAPVRFGGVKMTFRTAQTEAAGPSETRVIVGYRSGTPKSPQAILSEKNDTMDGPPAPASEEGVPKVLLGGILLLAFVVIFLILRTL